MIKDGARTLGLLTSLFPGFSLWWSSNENYNISDDGNFSVNGVFAEFSQFYIENFYNISEAVRENLFFLLELMLLASESDRSLSDVAESIKGCFLENIACTKVGQLSCRYMGKLSREFFDLWNH